jgi:hypothetical protein
VNLTQALVFELKSVCDELWSKQGQSLAGLVTTGQSTSPLSWRLFKEYKQWGLLHLLVLSGSQYYAFSKSWCHLVQGTQKLFFKSSSPFFANILLVPAAYIYLSALKMPAPLLRCALLSFAIQYLNPLKMGSLAIISVVFAIHIFFIERLSPSDSAFLSWIAFFTLQIVNTLTKNRFLRALIITCILHITVTLFKSAELSPLTLVVACVSNLISLPLFERILFPCVGYVSAASLLLCPLFVMGLSPHYFKDFIAPAFSLILDLAILPVLVANSAFRYTFAQ